MHEFGCPHDNLSSQIVFMFYSMYFLFSFTNRSGVHFDTSSSSLVNEIATAIKVYAYGVEDFVNDPSNVNLSLNTALSCEGLGESRWSTGDRFFKFVDFLNLYKLNFFFNFTLINITNILVILDILRMSPSKETKANHIFNSLQTEC